MIGACRGESQAQNRASDLISTCVAAFYRTGPLSPQAATDCSFCSGPARDMIQQMPSPVGHVLAGMAIGSLASRDWRWGLLLVCGLAAALPDIDLVLPVAHRGPTHSLVAALTVFAVTVVVLKLGSGRPNAIRVATALALAVVSHTLLDWLGQDFGTPRGIMAFWPFSREYHISGLDIFDGVERRYWRDGFWRNNMIAVIKEVIILLPLVLLARKRTLNFFANRFTQKVKR